MEYNSQKACRAREIFRTVYDRFRRKGGFEDTFADHPGFNRKSGKNNLTPWDRLVGAADHWQIDLPGYIFTALKQMMEDRHSREIHPHFLLNTEMLADYKKRYPLIAQNLEIRWSAQKLLLESELKQTEAMPWFESSTPEERELYVLLAEPDRFSSLFLFYHATIRGFDRLADETWSEARFEYSLFAPVYSSLLKNRRVIGELK